MTVIVPVKTEQDGCNVTVAVGAAGAPMVKATVSDMVEVHCPKGNLIARTESVVFVVKVALVNVIDEALPSTDEPEFADELVL